MSGYSNFIPLFLLPLNIIVLWIADIAGIEFISVTKNKNTSVVPGFSGRSGYR